jgi:hypothetical protein
MILFNINVSSYFIVKVTEQKQLSYICDICDYSIKFDEELILEETIPFFTLDKSCLYNFSRVLITTLVFLLILRTRRFLLLFSKLKCLYLFFTVSYISNLYLTSETLFASYKIILSLFRQPCRVIYYYAISYCIIALVSIFTRAFYNNSCYISRHFFSSFFVSSCLRCGYQVAGRILVMKADLMFYYDFHASHISQTIVPILEFFRLLHIFPTA